MWKLTRDAVLCDAADYVEFVDRHERVRTCCVECWGTPEIEGLLDRKRIRGEL